VTDPIAEVRRARAGVDRAQERLREAIVAAFHDRQGRTVDEIAEAAGLTRQRVYQIAQERSGTCSA
jgi:predicted transcriptional regulator